jgi:RecG-like helicase
MQYSRMWHRLLHDRTADQIAEAVADLAHANVTLVPYHLGHRRRQEAASAAARNGGGRRADKRDTRRSMSSHGQETFVLPEEVPEGVTPIASVSYRQRARVAGRVRSMRVQPWSGVATLECTLVDATGGLTIVFLGRKHVAGIAPGTRLVAEGTVGDHGGHLAILNPDYRILAGADHEAPPAPH